MKIQFQKSKAAERLRMILYVANLQGYKNHRFVLYVIPVPKHVQIAAFTVKILNWQLKEDFLAIMIK
jgi:hypothetical protein